MVEEEKKDPYYAKALISKSLSNNFGLAGVRKTGQVVPIEFNSGFRDDDFDAYEEKRRRGFSDVGFMGEKDQTDDFFNYSINIGNGEKGDSEQFSNFRSLIRSGIKR